MDWVFPVFHNDPDASPIPALTCRSNQSAAVHSEMLICWIFYFTVFFFFNVAPGNTFIYNMPFSQHGRCKAGFRYLDAVRHTAQVVRAPRLRDVSELSKLSPFAVWATGADSTEERCHQGEPLSAAPHENSVFQLARTTPPFLTWLIWTAYPDIDSIKVFTRNTWILMTQSQRLKKRKKMSKIF